MNHPIGWLRVSYWWGIIQDAFYCFPLLFPERLSQPLLGVNPAGNPDYVNSCRSHFPLMLAWTVLLIWADRKPLERKDVMLFTTLIVATKIAMDLFTGGFAWTGMWLARLGTLALFSFSYLNARHPTLPTTRANTWVRPTQK